MSFGLALGAISLISGIAQNERARRDANRAARLQRALVAKQMEWYDRAMGIYNDAKKAGKFDPDSRIRNLEKRTAEYEGMDAGNLAGALKVAGARAGDSEIATRLDTVKLKYRKYLDEMRDNLVSQTLADEVNTYRVADPSVLNGGIQTAGQQQQLALSQIQNPANALAAFLPYIDELKKGGQEQQQQTRGVQGGSGNTAPPVTPQSNPLLESFRQQLMQPSLARPMSWDEFRNNNYKFRLPMYSGTPRF